MKKLKESHEQEVHTVGELCKNLFTLQLEISEYTKTPITGGRPNVIGTVFGVFILKIVNMMINIYHYLVNKI